MLQEFKSRLNRMASLDDFRDQLIGEGLRIPGPDGPVPLVYADYVASGRAMRVVEDFVAERVLPFYANSHTETSYCGAFITALRAEARAEIGRIVNAGRNHKVIFAGSGATAGLNRLVSLLGVNEADNPVVFVGPYEHHSNLLPWRESKARVIEIAEAADGGPDLEALERALMANAEADLKIGAFSAASNVSGIVTDPDPVTRLLKRHGARAVWDYAGGGPYLPVDMKPGTDAEKDAVVLSPHKFPGGPAASGVLVVSAAAVKSTRPTWPGGGTVEFVSPWAHDYLDSIVEREEAGTPNMIGDIRAALAMMVKEAVGQRRIEAREAELNRMALADWRAHPRLTLLGVERSNRLPIFSFLVHSQDGSVVEPNLFATMLSDFYGIQARGGCACAGPYGHRLLGIDRDSSERIRAEVREGKLLHKPGWVRLNFSYLMNDATARYIIASVAELARSVDERAARYRFDAASRRYLPRFAAA